MTAREKLKTALIQLWKYSRFTSYFYQNMDLIENPRIETMGVSVREHRLTLSYQPDYISRLDSEHLPALLVHEMLHIAHNHHHRALPGADPVRQNMAQDMVINQFILNRAHSFFSSPRGKDAPALKLPSGYLELPPAFFSRTGITDPTWEQVYDWLSAQNARHRHTQESSPGLPSRVVFRGEQGNPLPVAAHILMDESDVETAQSVLCRSVERAAADRICSADPAFGEISALVSRLRQVDVRAWRKQIKSIIEYSSRSDDLTFSSSRFNRRFVAHGLYLEGRLFREMEKIIVAVDVSGSIGEPGWESAFGIVEEMMNKYVVYLLFIDTQVYIPRAARDGLNATGYRKGQPPYRYRKGDWRHIRSRQKGGTVFSPLFEYMREDNHRETLLIITDGYIFDEEQLPRYHSTLWVLSPDGNPDFHPRFGRVVRMAAEKRAT